MPLVKGPTIELGNRVKTTGGGKRREADRNLSIA